MNSRGQCDQSWEVDANLIQPMHGAENYSRRGVTLIELVAAITLLVILAVSTLIAIIPVSRQTRLNSEIQIATAEVRNVLEQINATPFNRLLDTFPDGTELELAELPAGIMQINYADTTAAALQMTVRIGWSSPETGDFSQSCLTVRTE